MAPVQGKLIHAPRLPRSGPVRYHGGMSKGRSDSEKDSGAGGDPSAKPVTDRKERLSAALRANLARRKGQARARKDDASAAAADSEEAPAGYGGTAEAGEPAETTHDSAGFIPDKPSS
jgi:hypothetical protein